jgi:hypothetical protein
LWIAALELCNLVLDFHVIAEHNYEVFFDPATEDTSQGVTCLTHYLQLHTNVCITVSTFHVGCFAVVSAAIVQNLPIYLDQTSSQRLVMI